MTRQLEFNYKTYAIQPFRSWGRLFGNKVHKRLNQLMKTDSLKARGSSILIITNSGAFRAEWNVVYGRVSPKADASLPDELDRVPEREFDPVNNEHFRERRKASSIGQWDMRLAGCASEDDVPVFDGRQSDSGPVPHVAHIAWLSPNVGRFVVATVTRILLDDADDQISNMRAVEMIEEADLIPDGRTKINEAVARRNGRRTTNYLTWIKVRRCRVAVILWRRWKAGALKDGRVAQLTGFRHVDVNVHARAVLVSVVMAGARLRSRRRAVVSPPIKVVTYLHVISAPRTSKTNSKKRKNKICPYRVRPAAPAALKVASRSVQNLI